MSSLLAAIPGRLSSMLSPSPTSPSQLSIGFRPTDDIPVFPPFLIITVTMLGLLLKSVLPPLPATPPRFSAAKIRVRSTLPRPIPKQLTSLLPPLPPPRSPPACPCWPPSS